MGDYFDLKQTDLKLLEHSEGRICIVVHPDGKLDQIARRLNRLTKGAIERLFLDDGFSSRKSGEIVSLPFPAGMKAKSIDVLILERTANTKERRLAGAGLAKRIGTSHAIIFCGGLKSLLFSFVVRLSNVYCLRRHPRIRSSQRFIPPQKIFA